MRFKKYEYYDNLMNNVKLLKVNDLGFGKFLEYKSQQPYPVNDISFAYLLDYIVSLNQIMATSKKNGIDRQTSFIGISTYEKLCKFFNQDSNKITVERLMHWFNLEKSFIQQQNQITFNFAFNNLKNQKENENEMTKWNIIK